MTSQFTTKYNREFLASLFAQVAHRARVEEFITPLSAKLLANMHEAITKNNIPATHLVIGSKVWYGIIADPVLSAMLDPCSQTEDLVIGYLGNIIGLDIVSDTFWEPPAKILPPGFCAVVAVSASSLDAEVPKIRHSVSTQVA